MQSYFRILLFLFSFLFSTFVLAEEFIFGPANSTIRGSISYATLGQYIAGFEKYKGVLDYDSKAGVIKSVTLIIDVKSIKSNCTVCDDIVRSKRLMDPKRFPSIIFTSQKIFQQDKQFFAQGFLEMHGVKKAVKFPFNIQTIRNKDTGRSSLMISGKWIIPRKEYGIVWNKTMDQGGFLVGNYLIVQWEVNTSS